MNIDIKPNYLVHWTGKDICTDLTQLNDENRNEYINRLEGTIENGLWMNPCRDVFGTFGNTHNDQQAIRIKYENITCFTELKLTMSNQHVQRYGLMGLGFNIDFVLSRSGAPVHYYQCGENDINLNIIKDLFLFLGKNSSKDDEYSKHFTQFKIISGLMKPMYDTTSGSNINNMEESEWRILQHSGIDDKLTNTGNDKPKYKIPFTNDDLKLIILPDNKTKEKFYNSKFLFNWIKNGNFKTTVLTYDDILSY